MGIGGSLFGRIDDYQDYQNKWNISAFKPHFSEDLIYEKGTINLNLSSGSTWTVSGQSWLSKLDGNNGRVILNGNQYGGYAAHIEALQGNNTFAMYLSPDSLDKSNMLYVKNASNSQTQTLKVINEDALLQNKAWERIRFATVATPKENFELFGNSYQVKDRGVFNVSYNIEYVPIDQDSNTDDYNGGKDFSETKPGSDYVDKNYNKDHNSQNIYLVRKDNQPEEISNIALSIIDLSRVNYANAVYMDRLNKRLGEACFIDGENGFWFRSRYDRIGKEEAFHTNNTMFNWGYNHKGEYQSGQNHYGVVFDYMYGKASYDNVSGSGDVKRVGLWFYDTWLGANGFYSDVVLKAARLDNDFDIYASSSQENIHGEFDNFVYSLSLEGGYKQKFFEDFYIEPQLQMQYAYVTDADYSTSQGTEVSLDSIDSLIGRLGIRLGKELASSNLYIKADVLSEFLGKQKLKAYDQTGCFDEEYQNDGVWFDIGMGFSYSMNKNAYVFFDVENSFGNDNEDSYQLNLGFNVSF